MSKGYIYVLINPSMQGYVKIGKTSRPPDERAAELSYHTGVPTDFIVVYHQFVTDYERVEKSLHERLEQFRISKEREFFNIDVKEAIDVVMEEAADFRASGEADEEEKIVEIIEPAGVQKPRLKFTEPVSVLCSKCAMRYGVTLWRYERLVVCPFCFQVDSVHIEW